MEINKSIKNIESKNYKFFNNFLDAMANTKSGHSLRKWLAVGFYWIMFILSFKYTDGHNLIAVLTIHASMITALIITYTAGNIQDNKLKSTVNKEELKEGL